MADAPDSKSGDWSSVELNAALARRGLVVPRCGSRKLALVGRGRLKVSPVPDLGRVYGTRRVDPLLLGGERGPRRRVGILTISGDLTRG